MEAPNTKAGFFIRLFAFVVDLVVVLVIYAGLLALTGAADLFNRTFQDERILQLLLSLAVLGYTSMEVVNAATLGKMFFRLRIGATRGQVVTRSQLFLRWSTKQSPWIVMFIGAIIPHPVFAVVRGVLTFFIICGMLPAMNDDHLAWHDKWSGTAVWKIRKNAVITPGFTPLPPTSS